MFEMKRDSFSRTIRGNIDALASRAPAITRSRAIPPPRFRELMRALARPDDLLTPRSGPRARRGVAEIVPPPTSAADTVPPMLLILLEGFKPPYISELRTHILQLSVTPLIRERAAARALHGGVESQDRARILEFSARRRNFIPDALKIDPSSKCHRRAMQLVLERPLEHVNVLANPLPAERLCITLPSSCRSFLVFCGLLALLRSRLPACRLVSGVFFRWTLMRRSRGNLRDARQILLEAETESLIPSCCIP